MPLAASIRVDGETLFLSTIITVMQFHLVSLNNEMPTGERWQIHKLNCSDVEKMVKRGDGADVVSAESREALIASQLADQLSEMGWTAEDF
jgi:hypothetical protein